MTKCVLSHIKIITDNHHELQQIALCIYRIYSIHLHSSIYILAHVIEHKPFMPFLQRVWWCVNCVARKGVANLVETFSNVESRFLLQD